MIIEPGVTNWASLEGQMLILATVHSTHASAIYKLTYKPTALINKMMCHGLVDKKPMMVFLEIVKPQAETYDFSDISQFLVNRGRKKPTV
jgi:saccharopine dehydrogenase-like NADP-dependent oxidoreductase